MNDTNSMNVLQRAAAFFTGGRRGGAAPVNVRPLDAEVQMLTRQDPNEGDGRQPRPRQFTRPITGGPGRPSLPAAPVADPLVFQYTPGVNLIAQPRAGFDLLPFTQLRQLADLCMEIRLPIELLKREVRALEWDVAPRQGSTKGDVTDQAKAGRELFARLDGVTPFDSWINMLVEEVLVVDAVTVYPQHNRAGGLMGFDLVDGATIRPLIDLRGKIPAPPVPAYIQTIRGLPVGQWNRDELWYMPYNTQVRSPYGLPPVELIVLMVNTSLRRALFQMAYYTAGNIPEALVGLPSDWDIDQIEAFQEYWDALLAGDAEKLRRLKFMPTSGGRSSAGALHVHEFKRPDQDTSRDEWLLRVGCWAVGVSPAEFGLVPGTGLGGAGFAQGQSDVQYRMGLGPMAQYIKGFCDRALLVVGLDDVEFKWVSLKPAEDALKQAQVDEIYIRSGVRSPQGVAEDRGFGDDMVELYGQTSVTPYDVIAVGPDEGDQVERAMLSQFFRPRQSGLGGEPR